MRNHRLSPVGFLAAAFVLAAALLAAGCRKGGDGTTGSAGIQMKGSDTMVNLVQAWAEEYRKVAPQVSVEVSGGGSGVGIAALIRGAVQIASSSRDMKPQEMDQARRHTGKEVREFTVGYDALAIYVHKENPLEVITFEQLAEIYAEGGRLTQWKDLKISIPGCSGDEIIRISRQSSSGTYEFFREHVLLNRDFKLGSRDMNGSKEVVELVERTPCAIGYSGMGYATPAVKVIRVAERANAPAFEPSVENTLSRAYPIARALHLYTLGDPQGAVKDYIDWILSPAGQKLVIDTGYVPVRTGEPGK